MQAFFAKLQGMELPIAAQFLSQLTLFSKFLCVKDKDDAVPVPVPLVLQLATGIVDPSTGA